MFNEPLSPNVTHIRPSPFLNGDSQLTRLFSNNPTVNVHWIGDKPAVYEFDLNPPWTTDHIYTEALDYFDRYDRDGHLYPVSVTGLKEGTDKGVGSHRFCTYDVKLSNLIENMIRKVGIIGDFNHPTCGTKMEFMKVSNYFRFMKYTNGGEHFPHWDSDFNFNGDSLFGMPEPFIATTHTLVMYFSNNETGEIAFINKVPNDQKIGEDWKRQATDDEIWLKVKPKCGKIVIFDHSLCHTVLPFTPNGSDGSRNRLIARGDLIFKTK